MLMEDIIVEPPIDEGLVDPMAWFDSPGPFEVEVGCGKGGFLLSRAKADPGVRLLGIEWANKYFRFCADRMARWQMTNVRVMRADARDFLMRKLPPACVAALHLYHPDPWPKKRHHKRRLVQPDFVEAVVKLLEPGGRWLIQSDHAEYFDQITRLIGAHPEFKSVPWEQARSRVEPEWAGTNYEVKYTRDGRRILRAAYTTS